MIDVLSFLIVAGPTLFAFGWLIVVFLVFLTAWETYMLLKMIDYEDSIQWTHLQVTLPEDSEETPKSMEIFYDVVGGIHKNPDLNEKYFDGYVTARYSCELFCTQGRARYILVVPTAHRKLFEGVVYGQYPKANIQEVEDYTLRYDWKDIREKFEIYGTEMILASDDFFPIKTYREFEATLAQDERFVDSHQVMVEAFTHVEPGEEFWVQVIVRPIDAGDIIKWVKKGEEAIAEISGQAADSAPNMIGQLKDWLISLPGELFAAFTSGPQEASSTDEKLTFKFFNPVDEAKMKGIMQKISGNGYKVKVRVIHIAPIGQLKKPNIGRAIGAFKQFSTFHMNNLMPDPDTKSNGPNYLARDKRRKFREKSILLNYQWRDMWGDDAGQMMNAEELSTLYHFPVRTVPAPSVERAKSGLKAPPPNVPYA